METLLSLTDAVADAAVDPAITDADIHALINRGLLEIAGGATRSFNVPTLPPLPDLYKEFTIESVVDANNTSMPADYQRGAVSGFNLADEPLQYYDSLIKFNKSFRSVTDNEIQAFCVRGKKVYYWGVPSSATEFFLGGYTLPDVLAIDEDIPSCLPDHLQHRLLVNYACMELYSGIEQDHKKESYNFNKYSALYEQALTDLFSVIEKDEEAVYIVVED